MALTCSFCTQETDSNLLAISSKVPMARICDKCLFRETEKVLANEQNLLTALDRIEKELRAVRGHITSAVESRIQVLNSSALALDSELGGLRDMKRQLQDALSQHGISSPDMDTSATPSSRPTIGKHDLRAAAVKRLVDERMTPASTRTTGEAAAS